MRRCRQYFGDSPASVDPISHAAEREPPKNNSGAGKPEFDSV
jgi:hypothetical protein